MPAMTIEGAWVILEMVSQMTDDVYECVEALKLNGMSCPVTEPSGKT
ncbi:hypothetical protein D9758_018291 [Tetrapyrgos nigripes]|uniref:Uncharacterized protein n=1 Tax=Tetrapyrgos nigripes TaxID=182062 RepID=A0A8H5EZQ8_9AGAR|nr:hypothetical protein D9758_018291 [Tetrapyrgos nigripes]